MSEVSANAVLSRLRVETRHLHDRVEMVFDLAGRLNSKGSYRDLLVRFYGFHAPLERQLSMLAGLDWNGLGFSMRLKTPLLRKDLHAIGMSREELSRVPMCGSLPDLAKTEQGMGCMYVLEGATLGGQIIRREVTKAFGAEHPCTFFSGYGERTGAMWQQFCAVLAGFASHDDSVVDGVVSAASDTFTKFEEWFLC